MKTTLLAIARVLVALFTILGWLALFWLLLAI